MQVALETFHAVWLVDFEFGQPDGERPEVRCMVAREYHTGHTLRLWADELVGLDRAPFDTGPESLVVAYYASAELGCFLSLGWPLPARVLDLFAEFRVLTNGRTTPSGSGLLGALAYFGLDALDGAEKDALRQLALRGGEYTEAERRALLDYCETDVVALAGLLPKMLPDLDLPRAVLRGRYMAAVARMEACGVPIDQQALPRLRKHWVNIQARLIDHVDAKYGVYEPATCGSTSAAFSAQRSASTHDVSPTAHRGFSQERFVGWLASRKIPWPRLESGKLALDRDTFREMAKSHPEVAPLHELRTTLGELRLFDLAVGRDGRNRCLLSAFRSSTGRNQPSNARFIFGPSCWLRGLIRPEPGRALAYVDWSQQEFGIAAALSGDRAMQAAYASGDPYLEFAKQAGAVPAEATKETHKAERDRFKACVLAVQYGMGSWGLAQRIGQPEPYAAELLRLHRRTYTTFWKWSDGNVRYAVMYGWLQTVFGWRVHLERGRDVNARSLANFPMQANGAEMLRLACCLLTERSVAVCCPVHDALLVEGPADAIGDVVAATQAGMAEASRIVLEGFELRTDAHVVYHPDRYMDSRGKEMWNMVHSIVDQLEAEHAVNSYRGGNLPPTQVRVGADPGGTRTILC